MHDVLDAFLAAARTAWRGDIEYEVVEAGVLVVSFIADGLSLPVMALVAQLADGRHRLVTVEGVGVDAIGSILIRAVHVRAVEALVGDNAERPLDGKAAHKAFGDAKGCWLLLPPCPPQQL